MFLGECLNTRNSIVNVLMRSSLKVSRDDFRSSLSHLSSMLKLPIIIVIHKLYVVCDTTSFVVHEFTKVQHVFCDLVPPPCRQLLDSVDITLASSGISFFVI